MRINLSAARGLTLLLVLSVASPQVLHARVEPSHGFDMFSAQEEVQAGQQAAAQVGKQLPLLPDSDPVTIYVQRLGANWPPMRRARSGHTASRSESKRN